MDHFHLNSDWRKTASAMYRKPSDSKILGSVEIDITDLNIFLDEQRSAGLKITLTHFFLLATARAVKFDVPQLNSYIKRGNVQTFGPVNVSVSVLQADGSMSSVKIENAEHLTLKESVIILNDKISAIRKGSEDKAMKSKSILAKIPFPFRNMFFSFFRTVAVYWGIDLSFIGLSPQQFGTFILSNIGTLGLDIGYPALMPVANVSFVFIMGKVQRKPLVIEEQIVPRTVITVGAAIDHRVADASHAGLLFKTLKYYVKNPQALLK
ncbi:MAG: 2-oxo acid dehydrogenase subunit E2 [Saprospiraceae bacterium]